MKSTMLKKFVFMTVLVTSGCTIKQDIRPVGSLGQAAEIGVVRNDKVRAGFLNAYVEALKTKGFQVKVLNDGSSLIECPITSTYTANWTWDLALSMRYAEIKVYDNATPVGEAVYDSTWGGGRPDKFIDAAQKVREHVDQLFPSGI